MVHFGNELIRLGSCVTQERHGSVCVQNFAAVRRKRTLTTTVNYLVYDTSKITSYWFTTYDNEDDDDDDDNSRPSSGCNNDTVTMITYDVIFISLGLSELLYTRRVQRHTGKLSRAIYAIHYQNGKHHHGCPPLRQYSSCSLSYELRQDDDVTSKYSILLGVGSGQRRRKKAIVITCLTSCFNYIINEMKWKWKRRARHCGCRCHRLDAFCLIAHSLLFHQIGMTMCFVEIRYRHSK